MSLPPFAMGKNYRFVWRRRKCLIFFSRIRSRMFAVADRADWRTSHQINPVWVRFARAMVPFAAATAKRVAAHVATFPEPPYTVLDIAAGHGLYGIEVAKMLPEALVTAVDWAPVLEVARANAEAAGVADRFRMLRGKRDGAGMGRRLRFDTSAQLPHHFDFETCTSLLRKSQGEPVAQAGRRGCRVCPKRRSCLPANTRPCSLSGCLLRHPAATPIPTNELDQMARRCRFSRRKNVSTYAGSGKPDHLRKLTVWLRRQIKIDGLVHVPKRDRR